ncbi:protamine-like [Anopheles maculipalpis]|uniref:protamine-like n=1 Tax=Anopheles maculipalpis TaxID=1496333 RepID=UPI002158A87C|nr:protamine-like [Anopheles maculipalpis]
MSCMCSSSVQYFRDFILLSNRVRNYFHTANAASHTTMDKPTKEETAHKSDNRSTPLGRTGKMMCRPGKQTRNPYLNFLRDYRRNNCHLSAVDVVRHGAEEWRRMTDEQKLPYVKIAFYTPLKRRRCPTCSGMPARMKRSAMRAVARRKAMNRVRVKKEQ